MLTTLGSGVSSSATTWLSCSPPGRGGPAPTCSGPPCVRSFRCRSSLEPGSSRGGCPRRAMWPTGHPVAVRSHRGQPADGPACSAPPAELPPPHAAAGVPGVGSSSSTPRGACAPAVCRLHGAAEAAAEAPPEPAGGVAQRLALGARADGRPRADAPPVPEVHRSLPRMVPPPAHRLDHGRGARRPADLAVRRDVLPRPAGRERVNAHRRHPARDAGAAPAGGPPRSRERSGRSLPGGAWRRLASASLCRSCAWRPCAARWSRCTPRRSSR